MLRLRHLLRRPTNNFSVRRPEVKLVLGCLLVCLLSVAHFTPARDSKLQSPTSPSSAIFTDVTSQAGITWRQFSGKSADRFLIETMGGGVAFLDFDGDGLQDIFFVNGGETPNGKSDSPLRNALYRNLGNGRFEDVAVKAGLGHTAFYGMGVAAADFDNDGFPDLYVTGFPSSALFHNNRDGTFTEVTSQAGVENAGRWAASAAWLDVDRASRPPSGVLYSSLAGYFREGSIAIVVEQCAGGKPSDVEIRKSVIVEVCCRHSHAIKSCMAQSNIDSYILESSIAKIPVQCISNR